MNLLDSLIPQNWKPQELPDPEVFRDKVIGSDIETDDPNLKTNGPGWARGDSKIISMAVSSDDLEVFVPVRFEMGINVPEKKAFEWIRKVHEVARKVIEANTPYEIGNYWREGIPLSTERRIDILLMEKLLVSHDHAISLESLTLKYLGEKKNDDSMFAALAAYFGGQPNKSQFANLRKGHPAWVAQYNLSDARQSRQVYYKLLEEYAKFHELIKTYYTTVPPKKLIEVLKEEMQLMQILCQMKADGVRVNIEYSKQLITELETEKQRFMQELGGARINAAADLLPIALSRGLEVPLTATGKPSFKSEWLKVNMPDLYEARTRDKLVGTFLQSYIIDGHTNGKLHGSFNQQIVSTGRLSSSDPNLQNIPARHEHWGPKLRKCYQPKEGHLWLSCDYKQKEFILGAHYAIGKGAKEFRESFIDDPKIDYHQYVADLAHIDRKSAKVLNLGLSYGLGMKGVIRQLGVSEERGKEIYNQYHRALPFLRTTMDQVSRYAEQRGLVRLWGGRFVHFPHWQPVNYRGEEEALLLDEAKIKWPHAVLERAYIYRSYNALIQGSAAAIMKYAMRQLDRAGILNVAPLIVTVHDELCFSLPPDRRDIIPDIVRIMTDIPRISVKLAVDVELGSDWGTQEKVEI